ncbi:hypothetical protein [Psychrobacter sp.]|uniref:hypothetical protein n=1 Tax=Psychrobacter sp. TaxID=56811 RepID=UPI0025F998DE|nr:hypothetical protein [Psychrobacter sp.]
MNMLESMSVMIDYPYIAFIITTILLLIGFWRNHLFVKIAALAWFCYGIWEYFIFFQRANNNEFNIRIDLLFIYPILILFTVFAIAHAVYQAYKKN